MAKKSARECKRENKSKAHRISIIKKILPAVRRFFANIYERLCALAKASKPIITALSTLSSIMIIIITIYYWYSNLLFIPVPHSLKINDPLTIPFIIRNNSIFDLDNVEIMAQINYVHGDTEIAQSITIKDIGLTKDKLHTLTANSMDTYVLEMTNWFSSRFIKIDKADIQINIFYKISIIPKVFTEKFRFLAMETKTGAYEYYPIKPAPVAKSVIKRIKPLGLPIP